MALIKRHLPVAHGLKILDVGCGVGTMLPRLATLGKVWGIDPSPIALKYAWRTAPNVKVNVGELPNKLPDRSFNLITMLDVIEHVDDELESLKQLSLRLKKDGVIVLTVPAYAWLWSSQDAVSQHRRRYSAHDLEQLIERADLEVVYMSYFNTLLFVPIAIYKLTSRMIGYRHSHVREVSKNSLLNKMLTSIFSWERHILINRRLPFGVSIVAIVSNRSKWL